MSGHSKWSQIKHKKGVADVKRGALFSKLLAAISVAAREEPNPQFNPRLRDAIAKAREHNVPQENIERALIRASSCEALDEVRLEAYGPEGAAIVIDAATDNKNRTVAELKHLLHEMDAKLGEPGTALWAFSGDAKGSLAPKFPHALSSEGRAALEKLIAALEARADVQRVITDAAS